MADEYATGGYVPNGSMLVLHNDFVITAEQMRRLGPVYDLAVGLDDDGPVTRVHWVAAPPDDLPGW